MNYDAHPGRISAIVVAMAEEAFFLFHILLLYGR